MTTDTSPNTENPVETALDALETWDAVAAAGTFAMDGRLVDPQYPEREYRGRESIREALEWALTNCVTEPTFTIRHRLEHEGTCALEVETRCDWDEGSSVTKMAFVVEIGDGDITHWRTYLPFEPPERTTSEVEEITDDTHET